MTKPQHEQDYETVEAHVYEDHVANALRRLHDEAAKVPGLELKLAACSESREAIIGALDAAKSERDVARRNADDLLTARDAALRERNDARERVATLEQTDRNWRTHAETVEDERDTAEARVKELTEAIRAKADDYRASHGEDTEGPHPLVDWADRLLRGTSQPPPAPAQGVDDVGTVREAIDSLRDCAPMPYHTVEARDAEAALTRLATPTQPTLVVPDEVRTALAGYLYEAQGLQGPVRELLAPGGRGRLTLATLRQVADILRVKPGVSR